MPDHEPESSPAAGGPADGPAVVVWVADGTWQATVDAARSLAPAGAHITLLHVAPDDVPQAGHGAYAGLLGRSRPGRDPGTRMEQLAAASAAEVLAAAGDRLARPATRLERRGRPEREVIAACEGADLLILGRDGDRSRLGPRSLGKATRFVLDHAPCQVLLVWPEAAPGTGTIPPPPPGPPDQGPHGSGPHGQGPHSHGPHGHQPHRHQPHGSGPPGYGPHGHEPPGLGPHSPGWHAREAPAPTSPGGGARGRPTRAAAVSR
jgi:nucleotide-binding universal stress UspA family protein